MDAPQRLSALDVIQEHVELSLRERVPAGGIHGRIRPAQPVQEPANRAAYGRLDWLGGCLVEGPQSQVARHPQLVVLGQVANAATRDDLATIVDVAFLYDRILGIEPNVKILRERFGWVDDGGKGLL